MGDTLYWFFNLGGGFGGGLIAFNNDRQFMKIGFTHFTLYIALMVTGAAIGAFYIAPALQVAVHTMLDCRRRSESGPHPSRFKGNTCCLE